MLLFTSDIDPTTFTHAAQHHLTHRDGQVSDYLPIVQVETLQNRSLGHVRDFSRIFASHSLDRTWLLPVTSSMIDLASWLGSLGRLGWLIIWLSVWAFD